MIACAVLACPVPFCITAAAQEARITVGSKSFTESVILGEVLAENHSLTNASGRTVDYVELFNPGENDLELDDLSLSNDPASPRKFTFADTLIPAGGRIVVRFDNDAPASPDNTGFSLSRSGDAVYFFDRPANGAALFVFELTEGR